MMTSWRPSGHAAHRARPGRRRESRQPLGLAVVGGLLFSQTLTLLVTPVFYLYMDRLQNRVKRAASRADVELAPAAE